MKIITRDTDYALRALLYIKENKNNLTSVKELTKELSLPGPFLRKILQKMQKHGILFSKKGINGGFRLNIPQEKVKMSKIAKIFQKDIDYIECKFKNKDCKNKKTCKLRKKLIDMKDYILKGLDSISLNDL